MREDSDAVEHLTLRARSAAGHDCMMRFSLANAAFKNGTLSVQFRQESPQGTLYASSTFERGAYSVMTDRLGLRAGKHLLEVRDGQLHASLDFGGLQADVQVQSQAASLALVDRSGPGFILRELLVPVGRVTVVAKDSQRAVDLVATGFVVHEASTAAPHRIYERLVQVHHLAAGASIVADWIVLPPERGNRVFGFAVLQAGGRTFVGEISKEVRSAEKADPALDYRVPWLISAVATRGATRAALKLVAEKQVAREDDLAEFSFLVRKAVGALFHPVTFTLKATATFEIQFAAAEPAVVGTAPIRFKYAQVR
ncbi:MAG: hypothetical protein EXR79_10885 [Myxococcales bacterium]|nr:hypothetical protein [Myxococcales bacterium]